MDARSLCSEFVFLEQNVGKAPSPASLSGESFAPAPDFKTTFRAMTRSKKKSFPSCQGARTAASQLQLVSLTSFQTSGIMGADSAATPLAKKEVKSEMPAAI